MASPLTRVTLDGQEVALEDLDASLVESAHADDYVLAELLKLAPYNGTTYAKAILPIQVQGTNTALLQVGAAATPMLVMPFRAVIGSRIQPTGTPPTPADPVITTAQELNFRDIRSAVFCQIQNNALGYAIPSAQFASNSSGNPRWDLIVAAVYVDQATNTTRFVKAPGSTTGQPTGVSENLLTSVGSPPNGSNAIQVVAGTPGGSPAPPGAPSDVPASGVFYIPLGAVLIPNGYVSGTSTLNSKNVFTFGPVGTIGARLGGVNLAPVDSSWNTGLAWSSTRGSLVLPSTMRGGVSRFTPLASSNTLNGAILDQSVDWRNRLSKAYVVYSTSASGVYAWQPAASGGAGLLPNAAVGISAASQYYLWSPGQSTVDDSSYLTGSSIAGGAGFLFYANSATQFLSHTNVGGVVNVLTPFSSTQAMGIYVNLSDGTLRTYTNGSLGGNFYFFVWIDATEAYDNR